MCGGTGNEVLVFEYDGLLDSTNLRRYRAWLQPLRRRSEDLFLLLFAKDSWTYASSY